MNLRLLKSRIEIPERLLESVFSQSKVDEPPHNFYKYPARFSPIFAREAISTFTNSRDTVLDPFCGGGTSLIEAISLGRKGIGFDISALAVFLTRIKATGLSARDNGDILNWLTQVELGTNRASSKVTLLSAEEISYHRNLPRTSRIFFETILNQLQNLANERQRRFIRLILLCVGQWALDCRNELPRWSELQMKFVSQTRIMLEKHYKFISVAGLVNGLPRCQISKVRRVLKCNSEEIIKDRRIPDEWLPVKLVLTSPPYPGVHVIYHRWQIEGRKETPAPFWLTNSRDGAGESYYCLGPRSEPGLTKYYENLRKAFGSIKKFLDKKTLIVQLVAFSSPKWQLPTYLKVMAEAGFYELKPICNKSYLTEGRIWRQVPGRRWYARTKGSTATSREVMLLHKVC